MTKQFFRSLGTACPNKIVELIIRSSTFSLIKAWSLIWKMAMGHLNILILAGSLLLIWIFVWEGHRHAESFQLGNSTQGPEPWQNPQFQLWGKTAPNVINQNLLRHINFWVLTLIFPELLLPKSRGRKYYFVSFWKGFVYNRCVSCSVSHSQICTKPFAINFFFFFYLAL